MKLKTIRHLWGFNHPFPVAVSKAKEAGYQGIENGLWVDPELVNDTLAKEDLELVIQIHTSGKTPEEHLVNLRDYFAKAQKVKHTFINAHSGEDGWSFSQSKFFFVEAVKIAREEGVKLIHETHRGRALFNPFITRDLCEEIEDLRLTADYSHFVCVCERLFPEDDAILRGFAGRVDYIHSRVGYSQGPQVSDPRAPEYENELQRFEAWWSHIWTQQKASGAEASYLCPEFGPQPYMPAHPYTRQDIVDLESVCDWMAQRQRDRFPG